MRRAVLGAVVGMLAGVLAVALLLPAAAWAVRLLLEPPMHMERWVIFVSLVLGAGFGALCGTIAACGSRS
jgi:hypothetical protein